MTTRFIKAVTLLACAVFSTLALADPPARVGRISLSQGQVSISGEVGDQASAALVNWPVTSHNLVTTGRGARTEIRIGSTSVRLDGDTSLEVSELDDDSLHLHLNYGSVNVRILSQEALAGFELRTSNGRVRLQEPGRVHVDAERVQGTSVVNVFDGVALVEDRGTQLIVRAGRSAEIRDDDVRTGQAVRDSFDDWSQQRDQYDNRSTSARYVTSEMTGYEDLDRNGVWRDDAEYGPLWLPTVVAPGWAPYRDGSWSWIAPWGWTWIDNAPWGYAPFHYGRWVQLNQRWAWAPGRHAGRPVWAPALVGWVGGNNWNLSFGSNGGHRPAQGWYPLTPRDAYVPGYRLSQQHLQHINRDARNDWRGRDGHHDHQREGLTVVPHEQFGQRGTVAVRNAPRAVVPPLALQNAPAAAPSAPQGAGRDRDGRGGDRFDRDFFERNRQHRPELTGVPAPRQQAPVATPGQQQPAPSPFTRRDGRPGFDDRGQRQQQQQQQQQPLAAPAPAPAAPQPQAGRHDGRQIFEERRQQRPQPMPAAIAPIVAPPAAVAAPAPPPPVVAPPQPAPEQRGRNFRNEGERRAREADAGQGQQPRQFAPPVMVRQQAAPALAPAPAPAPPPVARQAPQPAPQAAAQPAASEQAPRNYRGDHKRGEERER